MPLSPGCPSLRSRFSCERLWCTTSFNPRAELVQMKVITEDVLDGYRDGNRGELSRTLANVGGRNVLA
ncbi:MAG TPA: hypothetical protein VF990_09020 [Candidatus Dormibacteraeota bacterium]